MNILISRPTVPYCNCFPIYIGRLKITVFHFLFSCTMIFSFLWVGLYYVSRFFYERYCMLLRLGIFDILCSLESSLWCRYSNSPGKKYLNVFNGQLDQEVHSLYKMQGRQILVLSSNRNNQQEY